jgi:hypothetical protein
VIAHELVLNVEGFLFISAAIIVVGLGSIPKANVRGYSGHNDSREKPQPPARRSAPAREFLQARVRIGDVCRPLDQAPHLAVLEAVGKHGWEYACN